MVLLKEDFDFSGGFVYKNVVMLLVFSFVFQKDW